MVCRSAERCMSGPEDLNLPSEFANPRLFSLLFGHPEAKRSSDAALRDSVRRNVFTAATKEAGYTATVYRNTGNGGGIQLWTMPNMILKNAWRHLEGKDRSPGAFTQEAVNELNLVRDVLGGESSSGLGFHRTPLRERMLIACPRRSRDASLGYAA
jgi:hypothetical protein